MDCSLSGSSVHGTFQARILEWIGHFLLQGIFLTQESNQHLLFWQVDSLPLSHLGSPSKNGYTLIKNMSSYVSVLFLSLCREALKGLIPSPHQVLLTCSRSRTVCGTWEAREGGPQPWKFKFNSIQPISGCFCGRPIPAYSSLPVYFHLLNVGTSGNLLHHGFLLYWSFSWLYRHVLIAPIFTK